MRYRRVIAWSTHTFEDIRGEIESIPVITVIREVIDHIDSLTADSSDSSGTSGKPPQRRTRFNELKKQAARVLIRMAETVARVELTDFSAWHSDFKELVSIYRLLLMGSSEKNLKAHLKSLEKLGKLSQIAMVHSPKWKGHIGELFAGEATGADPDLLDRISEANIQQLELHLGVLSFRETAFLDKVALAPYVLSHGTDYGSSIRDNGVIICGPLVPKEDVKISTSPMNANEFEYSHEIFLRACCPTDAVFSHRYGRTTFIFDDHESKTDFYNRGWFTFYDPLMPFHGSIKQLIWPPELPLPEEVGEITPLRQTRWDESTYSRWRHQYAGGSHAEQFIDTVFKANVFHLAIGLKVLVELRRIAQSNPIGLAYRNALLDAPPNIISQIIYRDFFRIEAKIPVVMPVNRAKFVHIHRDIRTYSDGTPSCLAELDETLRKIQEYKPGAAKKSGKAQEPIADLVKKFEKQVSHIFCIGKSNANIKIRSLIKRELANPAIMADLINQIELIQTVFNSHAEGRKSVVVRQLCATFREVCTSTKMPKSSERSVVAVEIRPGSDVLRSMDKKDIDPDFWARIASKIQSPTRPPSAPLLGSVVSEQLIPSGIGEVSPLVEIMSRFIADFGPSEVDIRSSGEYMRRSREAGWKLPTSRFAERLASVCCDVIQAVIEQRALTPSEIRSVELFARSYRASFGTIELDERLGKTIQQTLNALAVLTNLILSLNTLHSAAGITLQEIRNKIAEARMRAVESAYTRLSNGTMWSKAGITDTSVPAIRDVSQSNIKQLKDSLGELSENETQLLSVIARNMVLFKRTDHPEDCCRYGAILSRLETIRRGLPFKSLNSTRNTQISGMEDFAFMLINVSPISTRKSTIVVRPQRELLLFEAQKIEWLNRALDPVNEIDSSQNEPAIMTLFDPLTHLGERGNVVYSGTEIRVATQIVKGVSKVTYPESGISEHISPIYGVFVGNDIPLGLGLYVIRQLRLMSALPVITMAALTERISDATPGIEFALDFMLGVTRGDHSAISRLIDKLVIPQIAFPVSTQFLNAEWEILP